MNRAQWVCIVAAVALMLLAEGCERSAILDAATQIATQPTTDEIDPHGVLEGRQARAALPELIEHFRAIGFTEDDAKAALLAELSEPAEAQTAGAIDDPEEEFRRDVRRLVTSASTRGMLEVETDPPGATIRSNDRFCGETKKTLWPRAGQVVVELRKDGFKSVTEVREIKAGRRADPIKRTLEREPSATQPQR